MSAIEFPQAPFTSLQPTVFSVRGALSNAWADHFGIAAPGLVDVEVTFMSNRGREIQRIRRVDPKQFIGTALRVRRNAAQPAE